jgi:OOP family OmpA-OmpF porin
MQRKILGAAVALAAFACVPAFAAPTGYVTAGVGTTKVDIDCTGTTSCDDSDVSGKVVAGWEFAPQVAAEVSYNYLGEPKATLDGLEVKIRSSYAGLGLAWRPQFNANWGGLVRAGAAFVNTKAEVVGLGSESHSSTHPYFGLGLTYAIDKNWGIELTWDRVDVSVDDGTGGDLSSTTDSFMLSGTYHF